MTADARSSSSLLAAVQREVDRSLLRARNGIKHAAGVNRARVGLSPKEVVWERDKAQLWRYHNGKITRTPPVLIVMSLVSRSYICGTGAVAAPSLWMTRARCWGTRPSFPRRDGRGTWGRSGW